MKHFNLKSLTIGAALAGSLIAGNVYAEEASSDLGLGDVEIVTLKWNNTGNFSGINGGTGWTNQGNGFGSPNGGNGRIGLIKKDGTTNQYYIACQGKYIKIENGACADATSQNEATAFEVTGSKANGLTFKTTDGYVHSHLSNKIKPQQKTIKSIPGGIMVMF